MLVISAGSFSGLIKDGRVLIVADTPVDLAPDEELPCICREKHIRGYSFLGEGYPTSLNSLTAQPNPCQQELVERVEYASCVD